MDLNQILQQRKGKRQAVPLKLLLQLVTGAQLCLGVMAPARLSGASSAGAGSLQGRSETLMCGGSVHAFCLSFLMQFHSHHPERLKKTGGEKAAEGEQCA